MRNVGLWVARAVAKAWVRISVVLLLLTLWATAEGTKGLFWVPVGGITRIRFTKPCREKGERTVCDGVEIEYTLVSAKEPEPREGTMHVKIEGKR